MTEKIEAVKFANSVRGQFILGQALWLAIEKLESDAGATREVSNIGDMHYLMDNLFPMYKDYQQARSAEGALAAFVKEIASKKEKQG